MRRAVNFGVGAGISAVTKSGKKRRRPDGQSSVSSVPGSDQNRAESTGRWF